jgi:hypothetical protein
LDQFWKEFARSASRNHSLKLEALIIEGVNNKNLRAIRETTPFYFDGKVFTTMSVSRPPIEHILLNVALFNFGNGDAGEIQELQGPTKRPTIADAFRLFRALGRVHWTRYLADLAAFGDGLQEIFHKQLSLVYVILLTLRCGDLRDISVRLFGAEPYRQVSNLIHNRGKLQETLIQQKTKTIAPDNPEFVEIRRIWNGRDKSPSSASFLRDDRAFLDREPPNVNFGNYVSDLIRVLDRLERFACGGNEEGYLIWQTFNKILDHVYQLYNVDRPLVALFEAIERDFRDFECAHEQLTAFVHIACEFHNAMTVCATQSIREIPVKTLRASDLHWNMDFTNTFCPFVALLRNEGGTFAARILHVLRVLQSGALNFAIPGFDSKVMWPFVHLTLRLKYEISEDFMGFRSIPFAASLFDDVAKRDWMIQIQTCKEWTALGKEASEQLSFFLLAWIKLEHEAEANSDHQARFGILALLLVIFAYDGNSNSYLALFCPATIGNLLHKLEKYYFWQEQKME